MSAERFDRYMERALYGPDGFYATDGSAGRRRGDFITSPEVGPLFGAVVAEAIDRWWTDAGNPDPFTVYDVGCGPGTLLKAIRLARPERPWHLIGVDVAGDAADLTELPEDLRGAVVIGNELLDNLPFRIVERRTDGYHEVHVADGQEVLAPLAVDEDHPAGMSVGGPPDIPVGTRAPLMTEAAIWVQRVLDRNPLVVCLFDYGAPETVELATRGGWLRTYRQHQRGTNPLIDPGSMDITTDVGWDQLPRPDELLTQT
ncbi:MAG: SAM-dependent methyltransferase, partial [Actinomycetota bacterium]